MRVESAAPSQRRLPRHYVGAGVLSLGLLIDVAAGLLILTNAGMLGLLLHVLAVLLWVMGVGVFEGCSLRRLRDLLVDAGMRRERHTPPPPSIAADAGLLVGRWTLAAAFLGPALIPGLGPIGCGLALAISRLLPDKGRAGALAKGGLNSAARPSVRSQLINPLRELEIQPIVDVLHGTDIELKRAAIGLLGRRRNRESVHLVREMLSDANPDVRSSAAVALTMIENGLNRAVNEATIRTIGVQPAAEQFADLANAYYRYASSDLLDEVSARSYLIQAREAQIHALALAPGMADYQVNLGRIHSELGEVEEAFLALDGARVLHPDYADGYLLGIDIAFRERRWVRLISLAGQGWTAGIGDCQTHELLRWWLGAKSHDGAA